MLQLRLRTPTSTKVIQCKQSSTYLELLEIVHKELCYASADTGSLLLLAGFPPRPIEKLLSNVSASISDALRNNEVITVKLPASDAKLSQAQKSGSQTTFRYNTRQKSAGKKATPAKVTQTNSTKPSAREVSSYSKGIQTMASLKSNSNNNNKDSDFIKKSSRRISHTTKTTKKNSSGKVTTKKPTREKSSSLGKRGRNSKTFSLAPKKMKGPNDGMQQSDHTVHLLRKLAQSSMVTHKEIVLGNARFAAALGGHWDVSPYNEGGQTLMQQSAMPKLIVRYRKEQRKSSLWEHDIVESLSREELRMTISYLLHGLTAQQRENLRLFNMAQASPHMFSSFSNLILFLQ